MINHSTGTMCFLVAALALHSCAGPTKSSQERARIIAGKADEQLSKDRHPSAIKLAREAIRIDSACAPAYAVLGRSFNAQHKYDSTWFWLSRATIAGVDSPSVLAALGIAADELTLSNEATAFLERAIQGDSTNAEAMFRLARLYMKRGELAAAHWLAQEAARRAPVDDRIVLFFQSVLADYKREFPRLSFEGRQLSRLSEAGAITRSQLSLLWTTTMHPSSRAGSVRFKDLDEKDSMFVYAAYAVASGFLESLPDRRFHPDYVLRRRNLAHYLFMFGRSKGLAERVRSNVQPSDVTRHDPQADAIRWTLALDMMPWNGKEFSPDQTVSGADAMRAVKKLRTLLDAGTGGTQ